MAMRFVVEGARKDTGADTTITVEADDAAQAEQIAYIRGLCVSAVRPDPTANLLTESGKPNVSQSPRQQARSSKNIRLVAMILIVAAVVGSGMAWAALRAMRANVALENEKKTLAVLMRLQAKTETGMTFRDYSSALADTWADVKAFLESDDSSRNPRFAASLDEAIMHYKAAADAWNNVVAPDEHDLLGLSQYRREMEQHSRMYVNEVTRIYSWGMASAAVRKAQAVLEGNSEQEQKQVHLIEEMQATLKKALDEHRRKRSVE